MEHTAGEDGEYDFKKEVHGEPGAKIHYKFRAGDSWLLQDDGPTATDADGNTNNVLEVVPQTEEQAQNHTSEAPDNVKVCTLPPFPRIVWPS